MHVRRALQVRRLQTIYSLIVGCFFFSGIRWLASLIAVGFSLLLFLCYLRLGSWRWGCWGADLCGVSFLAILWVVWRDRVFWRPNIFCKVIFLVASLVSSLPLFKDFFLLIILSNWKEVAMSNFLLRWNNQSWSPPLLGCFKLNFDGSAMLFLEMLV